MKEADVNPVARQYDLIFEKERANTYPVMDEVERATGFAIDRRELELMARVLACPLKVNPPNWQHGRLIYSALRRYLADVKPSKMLCLDIGTAKGFSALVMQSALDDAGVDGAVVSVDVIDPQARATRNTVAEVDGLKTLAETLSPFARAADKVSFLWSSGTDYLGSSSGRINFAFVDGKHKYDAVRDDAALLATRQQPGDITIFDDVHLKGVRQAVDELKTYDVKHVHLKMDRSYAVAVRL
jgi:predicted O-methyltransferase YrrM